MEKIPFNRTATAVFLLLFFVSCVQAVIHIPGDFDTVQAGIENATPGDVLIVDGGTYHENLIISIPIILEGYDTGNGLPLIDAQGGFEGISLQSNNIIIKNFVVENGINGLRLVDSNNVTILNCNSIHNENGIAIANSSDSIVKNCVLTKNTNGVFVVDYSYNNTIINNSALQNNRGIVIANAPENNITGNIVTSSIADGIYLTDGANGNQVYFNQATLNNRGIALANVSYNNVFNNEFAQNTANGIYLHASSHDNSIYSNHVVQNNCGILLEDSPENVIYDNIFINPLNAASNEYNIWNSTKTLQNNILGGQFIGGNYWANADGSGFSQTVADANQDGFCDSPFVIASENTDWLPLTNITHEITIPYSESYDSMSPGTFPSGYLQYYPGKGWEFAAVDNGQSHSSPNSFKMEGGESQSQEIGIPLSSPLGECIVAELYVRTARAPGDGREGFFTNHEAGLAVVGFLKPSPREGFGGVQFAYNPLTHEYNLLTGNETYTTRFPYTPDTWYKLKIRTNLVDRTFSIWLNDTPVVKDIFYSGTSLPEILLLNCDNGGSYTNTWYDDVHIWYIKKLQLPEIKGSLAAWGDDIYGQLSVPLGDDFSAISAHGWHTIALRSNGSLVAWGSNTDGQCDVPSGNDFVAIATGDRHSTALRSDGSIASWGWNGLGQCDVPQGKYIIAIGDGWYHSLAIQSDGSLIAWGRNDYGQCDVPSGNDYIQVTGGNHHSLALRSDGSIVAWGSNEEGQCNMPVGNDFTAIAAGSWHSLALRSNGTIVAWGRNDFGQCNVPEENDFIAVAAGWDHSIALRSNGTIVEWGENEHGQCNIPPLGNVLSIASGCYHSVALWNSSSPPPDTTPPSGVSNLHTTTITSNSITWVWDDPSDLDFVKVKVFEDGNFKENVTKGIQTYTVSGLSPLTQVTLGLQTVDSSENVNTDTVSLPATTTASPDTTPPSGVSNLHTTTITSNSITWVWDDPSDQDFVKVKVFVDGNFKENVTKGVQTYTVSGLSPLTQVTLGLQTVDSSENINTDTVSLPATTISLPDTTPPNRVSNLHTTTITSNSITWVWNDPSDPDYVKVKVFVNGNFKENVTKGIQSYTVSGLNPLTQVTLGLQTVDSSENINTNTVSLPASTIGPTPRIISVSPQSKNAGEQFELNIFGENFNENTNVYWDGKYHTKSYVSTKQLQIIITTQDTQLPGNYEIKVVNPGGAYSTVFFMINPKLPEISRISINPVIPITGEPVVFTADVTEFPYYTNYAICWELYNRNTNVLEKGSTFVLNSDPKWNQWSIIPDYGTYGPKIVKCSLMFLDSSDNKIKYINKEFYCSFFFRMVDKSETITNWESYRKWTPKWAIDPNNPGLLWQEPNWYVYWKKDGAVLDLDKFTFVNMPGAGAHTNNYLFIGNGAAGKWQQFNLITGFGNEIFGGQSKIDNVAATVVHEERHQLISNENNAGGAFYNQKDSDRVSKCNDGLPDEFEKTNGILRTWWEPSGSRTDPYKTDTYNIDGIFRNNGYDKNGDQEYLCYRAENALGPNYKVMIKDWSDLGELAKIQKDRLSSQNIVKSSNQASAEMRKSGNNYLITSNENEQSYQKTSASTSNFSEEAIDINDNGLIDYILINSFISINQSGYYGIEGWLLNKENSPVAFTYHSGEYDNGTYFIPLIFDCLNIQKFKQNGPYYLTYNISSIGRESNLLESYQSVFITKPYLLSQLEGSQISLNHMFIDEAIDKNNDSIYDYITVDIGIKVNQQGIYHISAALYIDDQLITYTDSQQELNPGNNSIPLRFEGSVIGSRKLNGPYQLKNIAVFDEENRVLDFIADGYSTKSYQYTQFITQKLHIQKIVEDNGIDVNNNTKFDILRLNLSSQINTPGNYTITGSLFDSYGNIIENAKTEFFTNDSGDNEITLLFDGTAINTHGVNGPFNVSLLNAYDESGNLVDSSTLDYSTNNYYYSQFEGPIEYPAPVVNALNPDSIIANEGSLTLTVIGEQFTGDSIILWDGVDCDTKYGSPSQLSTLIPANATSKSGLHMVSVKNPQGENRVSNEITFIVNQRPIIPDFSGYPTLGNIPLNVTFTDSSSGDCITGYIWIFGDEPNVLYSDKDIVKTFSRSGQYDVYHGIIGCSGIVWMNKTNYIIVLEAPVETDFTAQPQSGYSPLTVRCNDTSYGGGITDYQWIFSDDPNLIHLEKNVTKIFTQPGIYGINHSTTNNAGTFWKNVTDYIIVTEAPPPIADFVGIPESGTVPLNVQFNSTSDGIITSYSWDFGDGTNGTGTWLNHTYNTPGLYNVTLTVNSAYGSNSTTKTNYINVTQPLPPIPDFEGTPLDGYAPLDVIFTDLSTGMVTSRWWDFGDGITIWENETAQVSHSYPLPGTYNISLTVGNIGGQATATKTAYIQVSPSGIPPDARFTMTPQLGYAPMKVRFTDRSGGTPLKWQWNFGDGNSSYEQNPSHIYNAAGRFVVTLTVFNSGGSDTYSSYIWTLSSRFIFPKYIPTPTVTGTINIPPRRGFSPISFFAMNTTIGNAPLSIQFTDMSFNAPTSWQWDFGDSHTSVLQNPVNTFEEPGTYTVFLTVKNSFGKSTTSRRVNVR